MRPFLLFTLSVCLPAQQKQYPNLNATAWMQTSAEYVAATTQAYRAAERSMNDALADPNWTAAYEQGTDFRGLPPAVILDLDETVLDNSAFQARQVADELSYSDALWQAWVKEAKAGAIPGAVQFLNTALLKGVAPFYVTNRVCDAMNDDDATVKVLKAHRIPFSRERLLCKTGTSEKTERRKLVAAKYRVLLMVGDDFNDFTAAPTTVEKRADLAHFHQAMWGTKWFVIPNPTYGSWERAVGMAIADKLGKLERKQ
ncbi:MAG: acid phosphatase [Acidobacteria bacterium]|nr:acid phosphatase [Acidobacteriota bacterium]